MSFRMYEVLLSKGRCWHGEQISDIFVTGYPELFMEAWERQWSSEIVSQGNTQEVCGVLFMGRWRSKQCRCIVVRRCGGLWGI